LSESILLFNLNLSVQKCVKGMNNYRILLQKLSMVVYSVVFCVLIWCLEVALLKIFRFNKRREIFYLTTTSVTSSSVTSSVFR